MSERPYVIKLYGIAAARAVIYGIAAFLTLGIYLLFELMIVAERIGCIAVLGIFAAVPLTGIDGIARVKAGGGNELFDIVVAESIHVIIRIFGSAGGASVNGISAFITGGSNGLLCRILMSESIYVVIGLGGVTYRAFVIGIARALAGGSNVVCSNV